MSSKNLRIGILLVWCVFASCTASIRSELDTIPDLPRASGSNKNFLAKTRQQFPADQYLIGVGQGTSEKAATELARADLMKQIRAEVRVTWTDLIQERSGQSEQQVSRQVETYVRELAKGIEVVDQWNDSRTGTAISVVALPKSEVAMVLEGTQSQNSAAHQSPDSQEPKDGIWVMAEGIVSLGDDITVAEARLRSRDEAQSKAIGQAVGIFVRGTTVVYNSELAEDLVHSIVRGVVVEEQILSEGVREVDIGSGRKTLIYVTTLRAKVKPVSAERRGNFAVKGTLNKTTFLANEEMVITVVASEEAYIHIFSVGRDNAITVLFPNKFRRGNLLSGKKKLIFPDDELREMGVRLRVLPPLGANKTLEKIKLIATKRNLDLVQGKFNESIFQSYQGHDTGLVTDLMKGLTELEDTDWAEMTVSYEVLKK